ncbi:carbohydrate binding domain-containing protein [Streptomyces mirabilis]
MARQRRMGGMPGPLGASGEASNGQPVTVELLVNGVWVDITAYVMVRDDQGQISLTKGIRDEGNQTEQATGSLPLKNQDGRFTPRNAMGVWYGLIGRNQPFRVSVPDGMGGKSYRLWGEVPKWPASWDPTGNDVWVDVSVNGILQRLAQGPAPERSVVYNAVTNPIGPQVVAYWPCEDPSDATTIASALVSGSPMTISGTPTLASYTGFGASDPLPGLTSSSLSGGVVAYDEPTATQVRFLAFIPAIGLSDGKVICAIDQVDYSAGSAQFWELYYSATSTSLTLRMNAADGSLLGIELPHTLDVRGRQMYISVEFQESGTAITRAVRITDINSGLTYSVTDTANVTQLSRVTKVQFGPASRSAVGPNGTQFLPGVAIGHVTVENTITAVGALGVRLNPVGEAAGRRIQRLCGEAGIPFDWVGDLDDTVDMGAQGKTNPLSLMQEAVLADAGLLYENLAALGLGYRTRASLYNQDPALVLNYSGFNLSQVPTPVEDDRYLANRVTVSVGGVTATYEETAGPLSTAPPPSGVGVYGPNASSPLALNLATSDTPTLLDQAAWRVHLGTVDEARYPQISVNLAHASITPDMRRAILGLRMGDRVQIINPPAWLGGDTIDQLVLGFSESITHFQHRLTFTCAPASPYNSIGYLDTTTARIDTDGSQLAADLTSTTTSLTVATTSGPGWVQSGQLNTNRNFEVDLSNWTASGATLARVATPGTPPFGGQWSLQITPDGVSQFPNAGSEQIAVTVGQQYVLSGWLLCAVSRNVDLNINWFDNTHAYLSTTANDQQVTANTWTYFQQTVTPPGGAVYANLSPTVPSFPPSSNVLYADEIVFRLATDTTNDDFPFDIRVGGEIMRAGAITPAILDTFTRTVANGWGTADTGQTWTTSGGSAADYYTQGAEAVHSVGVINSNRFTLVPSPSVDVDLQMDVATGALATGGPQYTHLIARATDVNNNYNARIAFNADQSLTLVLEKRVGGIQTDLATVPIPGTHAAFAFFTLRFQVQGSTLRAKAWLRGQVEPPWQATATDTSLTAAGSVGVRSILDGANTNPLPVLFTHAVFQLLNPQTFVVTRSINGVVKAHSAGEDVRLAYPTILAE